MKKQLKIYFESYIEKVLYGVDICVTHRLASISVKRSFDEQYINPQESLKTLIKCHRLEMISLL